MKRLFVANIPFTATEADVKAHFRTFGFEVSEARIITDRDTNNSRGFGFVEMGSEEDAARAIAQVDGSYMGGRPLTVREATQRPNSGPPRGRNDRGRENDRHPQDGRGRRRRNDDDEYSSDW